MPAEGRDPSGYVTSPPSIVVKVLDTGRDDINGLLGIVVSYNMERERYLVHMADSQSTMALRKENLGKANVLESYLCQWQRLKNDPRVKEKKTYYISICRQYVAPFELSKVILVVCLIWLYMFFRFGIAKTIMVNSLVILILVITGPDIFAKSSTSAILKNFPNRARETLEQQMPVLKGRLTDRMATGIILLLLVLCLHSLLSTKAKGKIPNLLPALLKLDKDTSEKYYNMGFEDATNGFAHGTSLSDKDTLSDLVTEAIDEGVIEVKDDPNIIERFASVSNLASIFYIYKSVGELGVDQRYNMFSIGQLAANLQHHTELWKKALLLLSLYNIVRVFI